MLILGRPFREDAVCLSPIGCQWLSPAGRPTSLSLIHDLCVSGGCLEAVAPLITFSTPQACDALLGCGKCWVGAQDCSGPSCCLSQKREGPGRGWDWSCRDLCMCNTLPPPLNKPAGLDCHRRTGVHMGLGFSSWLFLRGRHAYSGREETLGRIVNSG